MNCLYFSSTFTIINEKQVEVSKMQRYRLIREFSSRSMVPPPLCVFTYPYFIIKYLVNLCKEWQKDESTENKGNKSGNKRPRLSKSPPKAFCKTYFHDILYKDILS